MSGKRILSFILALVMVLGMVPFNALPTFAAETDGWYWNADKSILYIKDGSSFELYDALMEKYGSEPSRKQFFYTTDGSYTRATQWITYGQKVENNSNLSLTDGTLYYFVARTETLSVSSKDSFTAKYYYKVTVSENANTEAGSATNVGSHTKYTGETVTINITLNEGWKAVINNPEVSANAVELTESGTYTTTANKSQNVTITYVSTAKPTHGVTMTESENADWGNLTVSGLVDGKVTEGEKFTVTVTPNGVTATERFYIKSITVGGVPQEVPAVGASFTKEFTMGTTDVAVEVTYGKVALVMNNPVGDAEYLSSMTVDQLKASIFGAVINAGASANTIPADITANDVDIKYYPWGEGKLGSNAIADFTDDAVALGSAAPDDTWTDSFGGNGLRYFDFGQRGVNVTEKVIITGKAGTEWADLYVVTEVMLVDSRNEAEINTKPLETGKDYYTVPMNGFNNAASQADALNTAILAAVIASENHDGTPVITVEESGTISGWFPISDFDGSVANVGKNLNVGNTKNVKITYPATSNYPEAEITVKIYFAESRPATTINANNITFTADAAEQVTADAIKAALNGTVANASWNDVTVTLGEYTFPAEGASTTMTVTLTLAGTAEYQAAATKTVTVTIVNPVYNPTIALNGNGIVTLKVYSDAECTQEVTDLVELAPGTYFVKVEGVAAGYDIGKVTVAGAQATGNNDVFSIVVEATSGQPATTYPVSATAEKLSYTVSFGGDATEQTVTHGETATKPADPAKEGHKFLYWELNGEEYDFSTPVTGNVALTAKWDVEQYSIEWYVDGTLVDTTTFEYGANVDAPSVPAKEGYGFAWNTTIPGTMPAENLKIYGTYTAGQYTVTWNVDGTKTTVTYSFGDTIVVPAAPTKEGHTFTGWNGYTDGMTMPAENVEYTATWTVNSYTITWKGWNATSRGYKYELPTSAKYGEVVSIVIDRPSKEGYNFTGFASDEVAVADRVQGDRKVYSFTMPAENVTIEATFQIKTYTIKFVDENGNLIGEALTVEHGQVPVAPTAPEKADTVEWDYSFAGWEQIEGRLFENGTAISDAVFKATYTSVKQKYTVTFYDYNGTTVLWSDAVEYGIVPAEPTGFTVPANHKHTGWNTTVVAVTGAAEYKATYSLVNNTTGDVYLNPSLTGEGKLTGLKNKVLTAAGLPADGNFTVYMVTGNGNYNVETDNFLEKLDMYTRFNVGDSQGFIIVHNDTQAQGNITVSVKDNRLVLNITTENLNVSGKTEPADLMAQIKNKITITATNPETGAVTNLTVEDGYISIADYAWPADGTTGTFTVTVKVVDRANETYSNAPTATLTLTCVDTTVLYNITWDINGDKQTVQVAENTMPAEPTATRKYYDFAGWDKIVVKATEDTTYTATWVPTNDKNNNGNPDELDEFTVKFVYNGKEQEFSGLKLGDTVSFTPDANDAPAGQYFAGWDRDVVGVKAEDAATGTCVITYTAQWDEKCTVTIVYDNGTANGAQLIVPGNTINLANPTYDQHIFAGWYVNGVKVEMPYTVETSMTITAMWLIDLDRDHAEDGTEADPYWTVTVDGTVVSTTTLNGDYDTPATPEDQKNMFFVEWIKVVDDVNHTITFTANWNTNDTNDNNQDDSDETITVIQVGGTVTVNGAVANGDHIYDSTKAAHTIVITPAAGHYVKSLKINGNVVDIQPRAATVAYDNGKLTLTGVTLEDSMTIEVEYAEHKIPATTEPYEIPANGFSADTKLEAVTKEAVLKAVLGETAYNALTAEERALFDVKMYINIEVDVPSWAQLLMGEKLVLSGYHDIWNLATIVDNAELQAMIKSTIARALDTDEAEDFQITWAAHGQYPQVVGEYKVYLRENRQPTTVAHNGDKYLANVLNDALLNEIKADLIGFNTEFVNIKFKNADQTIIPGATNVPVVVIVTVKETEEYYGANHEITVYVDVPTEAVEVKIPETATVFFNTGMSTTNKVELLLQTVKHHYFYQGTTIEVTDVVENSEVLVEYLASTARNVPYTINIAQLDLGLFGDALIRALGSESITVEIPVGDLWLPMTTTGNDFPVYEAPSNELIRKILVEDLIPRYGADYLAGDISNDQLKDIAADLLANHPDIANYYMYLGAHQFGELASETIHYIIATNYGSLQTNDCVLTMVDERTETEIKLNTGVQVVYNNYTEEQLLARILDGVYANGNKIDGLTVEFVTDVNGLPASDATEVTVKFAGNQDYKPATATVTIKINKAPLTLSVDNRLFKWPASLNYSLGDVIITKSNGTVVDVDTINFIAGLNISEVNLNDGLKGFVAEVQLMLPEELQSLLVSADSILQAAGVDVSFANGASMKLSELLSAVDALDDILAGTEYEEYFRVLLNVLQNLPTDVADIKITIGGGLPTDIGVYVVGSISADPNYETAYGAGVIVITPDGIKADLAWNETDDNGIITNSLLANNLFDAGAHAVSVGAGGTIDEANAQIVEVFVGLNIDELDNELKGLVIELDQTKLGIGAYVEVALISDFGNQMYYAMPIVRPIVVVAETLNVDFVDASGAVNNERHFEFFNVAQKGMENLLVTYKKDAVDGSYKAGDKVTEYSVKYLYVGIQTNGQPYASTQAPVHAGVYTVTAVVIVREDGVITHAGQGIGALVIEPSKSTIDVENEAIRWDGEKHNFNQFVHADSVNVPGLTPDTTVITAGIHADLNANVGLNAIQGSVNVDLPTWMDELMKKLGILEAGYTDEGITLAEFQSYVEKIESAIAELGVGTESFNKLVDVIAQLPDKATLTFHDNKGYDEVGAYLVVGIVTDSDHWPSADAGIVVIYPDAEKVELEYQKTWDDNNVFTWNVLQHYDLNAQANYAKDPALNNWLTDRAVNLFVGFADHGELILTADKADLDNGIYAEVSFLLVVDNVMYYAEPIAREVIIVPNPATIDFLDDANNVNNERHFQFFNKPWAMDRVLVTLADGTELILTADDDRIDIYYVGIQLNGQPYYSTEAPVHAGVYEVTAQYTERKDGKVYNLGIGVGVLAIEPSKSDIAVDNGAYPFGQTHYVNDLINAVSVNVPAPYRPDSTVISVGLSTNLDAISGLSSINGTVNVDLPTWMDNVLAKLNVLEAGYANGISAETFLTYVEKIEAGLLELGIETDTFAEITNVIKQLPINTNLTFQDNIGYTEVGAYLIIAVVTDSDHYPSVGAGVMVIYPDATKAELKFEEDWNDNNIFTWSALQNMNLEAEAFVSGIYSEAASKHVTNLFVGFTSDGTVMLEAVSFGEHVKDLPEFKNGVYSQVAVLLDLGNQMYYAEPISRAFVIVPTPATIEFVDGNGNVNADRHFVFNNQPHAMDVRITVNGVVVTDQTGLTVRYTGVMTNGQAYDSNMAPVNAGAYVVTATYTARDEHDRLVTLGMTVGAMVIEPAKAEINVENEAHEFGSTFETESMITVNSDVNVNIDKTIITVGLKTDGTFSENGLQAIDGDINVDLPEWLDDVLSNYSIFANGLSVAEFKNAVASVKAELAELGISTEILDRLVNVVEQFPATATLTFHDQADMAPAAVGAYLVIGVVTDSNFYPAMDAGLLVIYPDVNKTELSWIYEDTNNIYTKDTLEIIDLGAKADADIADLIVNLFIGVDAENWKITLENNQTELNIGIYEEFSFVKPNVNSVIYYAEPISRPVIVVANVYNVSIHDQVVTEMFDNTGKDMGEITITTMTGEVVDVTNGTLTVTYVGIDTMLRPYYSTEKPVHAGTYTVIATYMGNDGDGDLSFGAGIGQLIITPADVEIDAPSHAGLASQDYELNIQTKHDAVNDEPKILTIIAGVDLSAYITEGKLGIDGTVNVDFPEAIDAVLSELFPELYVNGIGTDAFFAKYDEMVAAIEARGYSADLLKQLREKLAQLNAANLTFRDDVKPTDTGLYAVIAMVCDPDYKFDMDTALIAISPDATVAELDFVMDMPPLLNAEILPFDMVDEFDFHAYVSALKSTNSGLNPEDIVLKDVIFGLTSDLQLFLGSSEEKPNEMGIYDQIAYAPAAENNLLAILPIHRDFLITDSSANVVFVDPNGNVNWLREFTYGETVDMGASIMLADGTILTATPNVHYMGIENGIVFYNSTEVPTDAGLYTVIGYFVDAEQNIYTIGLGELLIKPKQITITVADETITAGETPVLNYTVDGLENGDDLNVNVTVDGDYSVAGTYDINATYTADPNYIVTVVNGKLTVEEKQITGEIIRNSIVPSLRLRGEVHINIHFQVRGFDGLADLEGKMGLLVWTNNNLSAAECDVTNAEFNLQGGEYDAEMGKYTVRSQGISAKNMGDKFYFKIYVQLDDGTYVYSDRFSYSAQKYCVDNLNNSNDEELKAVCVALMNYGADAQIYFAETSDYTYETLMNDLPVIDQHQHLVGEYNDDMITDLKAMDPSKHGEFVNTKGFFKRADPYVSLTGALQLNYKITVKNTEYTEAGILVWTEDVYNSAAVLTHENATKITYEGTGAGVYDVRFTGISAKDMGKTVYACAYMIVDGEYKYSGMFTYSIEEYAKSVQNSNVEDILHNVVESMVVYGDYAREYFLNH